MWSAGFRVEGLGCGVGLVLGLEGSGFGVGVDLGLEVLETLHQVALHLLLVRVQPGFVFRF